MASKSIDWDSVLVTQDPKKKEVVISFPGDGFGFYGSLKSGLGGADPGAPAEPIEPPPPEPEPVPPVEPLPECVSHSCDAIKDIAFTGNVGGYYETIIPANPATGEIYDQFGGDTGLFVVNGGYGNTPTFTEKLASEASSLTANTSAVGSCYNFKALNIYSEAVISDHLPIQRQIVTSYSLGGSVVPIRVERTYGTVIGPGTIRFTSYVFIAMENGSYVRYPAGITISNITNTSVGYNENNSYGGGDLVTVQTPPSIPGVPDVWSFKIAYNYSEVSPESIGLDGYPGVVGKIGARGTIAKNGVIVASGFRCMYKSGYNPNDFEMYHYNPSLAPVGLIKERYLNSPQISGTRDGFYDNCALSLSAGGSDKFSPSTAALKARQAFSGYQAPSYCEVLQ